MATIGGSTPTVNVTLPVPTPVPTPKRQPAAPPQPVPRAAKPTLAPVPGGMGAAVNPEPVLRSVILPWKAAPRQMRRGGRPARYGRLRERAEWLPFVAKANDMVAANDSKRSSRRLNKFELLTNWRAGLADFFADEGDPREMLFRRATPTTKEPWFFDSNGEVPSYQIQLPDKSTISGSLHSDKSRGMHTFEGTEQVPSKVSIVWHPREYRGPEHGAVWSTYTPEEARSFADSIGEHGQPLHDFLDRHFGPRQMHRALPRRRLRREGGPVRYATPVGKYGTPEWNPPPHPQADPDAVARRGSDPLWAKHRSPKSPDNPSGANPLGVANYNQIQYHTDQPNDSIPMPEGLMRWADAVWRHRNEPDETDLILTRNLHSAEGEPPPGVGALNFTHPANQERYNSLWNFHGTNGRRPWYKTVYPLQTLENFASPHDPYRLLAASVLSGNRHALPALVDLLKRRDNPAGWAPQWGHLARAMEQRVGDLSHEDVFRRTSAIAYHSAKHSRNPDEHNQIAKGAFAAADPYHGTGDFTGVAALADHMDENGLPQYAQLMRAELANVMPQLRSQPKGRSRLSRLPRRRVTPDA